jgi:hypothetical protein
MKQALEELLAMVYRYYPRGLSVDDLRYRESEEWRRIVAERRRAGATCESWRQLLRRLGEQFPEYSVQNRAIHLPVGEADASYSAYVHMPVTTPGEHSHSLGFLISFLVPYYIVYSTRIVDAPEAKEENKTENDGEVTWYVGDTCYVGRRSDAPAHLRDELEGKKIQKPKETARRIERSLDPTPEEQPCASWIAREIESMFGYERMPSEVGKVIVPDVATNLRSLGEATLYDCLFSDDW